jgi:HSP20 family protein
MKYPSLFTGLNSLLNFNEEWDNFLPAPTYKSHGWTETDKGLQIQFDVPGLKKEDLKIEVSDQVLSISGVREIKTNYTSAKKQYFYQTFLPEGVEADQVEANLDNGVLTLTTPNPTPVNKTKTITIK